MPRSWRVRPHRTEHPAADAPDISKVDTDRHLNPGLSAWDFSDEVVRRLFHGNSLSDPKDQLIPFVKINVEVADNPTFQALRRFAGLLIIVPDRNA